MTKKNILEIGHIEFRFIEFIKNFRLPNGIKPYCYDQIYKNFVKKNIILNINLTHIADFDPQLYLKIIGHPSELANLFDYSLNNLLNENILLKKNQKAHKIKTSFWCKNLSHDLNIEEISPELFNKLVSIQGRIIKVTKALSELSSILFKCEICEFETYSTGEMGHIKEPIYCFLCKNFNSFRIIHNRSYFSKIRFFNIQNELNGHSIKACNKNLLIISRDNCDKIFSEGDMIKATGILRIHPYYDTIKKTDSVFFGIYLDSLNIFKCHEKYFASYNSQKNHANGISQKPGFHLIEDNIMIKSIMENLNYYSIFQDACFTGQFGIDCIKKTFALLYLNKKNKSVKESKFDFSLLIHDKNDKNSSVQLKNIFASLKRFVSINGKSDDIKTFLHSFELSNDLKDNKYGKGKFFNNNNKLCLIDNLDFINYDTMIILKEILNNQKISITKAGLNFSMKTTNSIVGIINGDKWVNKTENSSKNFKKFFKSLVYSFNVSYIFKIPRTTYLENYMLKYYNYIFLGQYKKRISEYLNLKKIGLKKKGGIYFLDINRIQCSSTISFFSSIEVIKLSNLIENLIKLKNPLSIAPNTLEIIEHLSFITAKLRFSEIVGVEDVRLIFMVLIESLKSNDLI